MNVQTIINIKLSLELDEPEAREFLVDPSNLQAQIREALAQAHRGGHNNDIVFGKADGKPPRAKVNGRKAAVRSGRNPFARAQPCPECGLKYHRAKSQCTRNPHRTAAPAADGASAE